MRAPRACSCTTRRSARPSGSGSRGLRRRASSSRSLSMEPTPPRGSRPRSSSTARAQRCSWRDVGLHRTGQTTAAGALALAQRLAGLPALEVAGISCYPVTAAETRPRCASASTRSTPCCARPGTPSSLPGCAAIASPADSTPTRFLTHETCVNELRSGTYALLDRTDESLDECALHVEVSVISDAVPGQIVIDAGSKTLTSDTAPEPGNGTIVGMPGADLYTINEEHGYVDVSTVAQPPAIGDHLRVIPNHACGCVNLHDGLLAVRTASSQVLPPSSCSPCCVCWFAVLRLLL